GRSLMLVACSPDVQDLPVSPAVRETLFQHAGKLSLDTILAGLEVWTASKARMRGGSHPQVLLEMAVVRLASLDELLPIGQLLQANGTIGLPSATPAAATSSMPEASKKNYLTDGVNGSAAVKRIEAATERMRLSSETLPELW